MQFPRPSFQRLLITLNFPTCRNLALTLLSYLQIQQMENMSQAFQAQKEDYFFIHLVRNHLFVAKYLNCADKSLYFSFYEEKQYKEIEHLQIAQITQQKSAAFVHYHHAFNNIITMLQQKVPVISDEIQTLKNLLIDPQMPLPKLKRQTQGMYCSSAFQLFLVDSYFNAEEPQQCYCFQNLKIFLDEAKQEEYIKQFLSILKDKQNSSGQLHKIMKIRYAPYEVNMENFSDYLIPDNQLHSFIVGMFALTDVMVQSTHSYLQLIDDPLHRLIQFLLRYSIFRNFVLATEEYLAFSFKIYQNVYCSIEADAKKPKYKFWRPALTKWFLKMDYLRVQSMQVYMHCLTKLRSKKIYENINEMCNEDQQKYGKVLNYLEFNNTFQYKLAEKVYSGNLNNSNQIGVFFDNNPENYEMVVMQFNQYLLDISVNEQSVHWCGHSSHQLEAPYIIYQSFFLQFNQKYIASFVDCDNSLSQEDRHIILKVDLQYLSFLQIKNRTLKKIVDITNQRCGFEQSLLLKFDFQEADKKLQYFNKKAFIMRQMDQNERPFYSIPPLVSAQKLIEMLDTNDSSNNNSEEDNYQYRSDSENCEEEEGQKVKQKVKSQFFKQEEQDYCPQQDQLKLLQTKQNSKKVIYLNKVFVQDYGQSKFDNRSSSVDQQDKT